MMIDDESIHGARTDDADLAAVGQHMADR